jgi:hypothetical protein
LLSSRLCRQNDRVDHCMTPLLAVYRFSLRMRVIDDDDSSVC